MAEDAKKAGRVTIRLQTSTEDEIKRRAKAEDRAPAAVARRLIESALERASSRGAPTGLRRVRPG